MKILLFCSSYNGLSQKIHQELKELNHDVSIEFSLNQETLENAVSLFKPALILCPYLKEKIPKSIYENNLCLIFHPGIIGDRGPSSLDWAILEEQNTWGLTVIQASGKMDAGDIWASSIFKMPQNKSKASIYRKEISKAAVLCLHELLKNYENKDFKANKLDYSSKKTKGMLKPFMLQENRSIDFLKDSSKTIIKKINSADSYPGLLCTFFNKEYFIYDAHFDNELDTKAFSLGEIIAKRNLAVAFKTLDGAIWITHMKSHEKGSYKLPCTIVLKDKLKGIKENRIPLLLEKRRETFYEIYYEQEDEIGYLYFDFYNGAMSIEQCVRLKYAIDIVKEKDIKVLVLMGGKEFFSNGINLNIMEESLKSDEDGWSNIHAMNDILKNIILSTDIITVASLGSNAGAGGSILAIACDYVVMKDSTIINPHYKTLGLHGSEYWTYLLPKRVGLKKAYELTNNCLAINAKEALKINYCDKVISSSDYYKELNSYVKSLEEDFFNITDKKQILREKDESKKALEVYRKEELEPMYKSFFDKQSSFNTLRCEFVYKKQVLKTPKRLAKHSIF